MTTQGPPLQLNDDIAVVEFYYTINDCLFTLRIPSYVVDPYIIDTLCLLVKRLSSDLRRKWAERSITIRGRGAEPNLLHIEKWLQGLVHVLQEVEIPVSKSRQLSETKSKDLKQIYCLGLKVCLSVVERIL